MTVDPNFENDTVDFHAHILPGADHGSSSVQESLSQLLLARKYGVGRIIATPHFYPQSFDVETFINRRNTSFESLTIALADKNLPDIVLGSEVLLCENIYKMNGVSRLCIGNSNVLLLELPNGGYDFDYSKTIRALIRGGFRIVLAHADRYKKEIIYNLLREDIDIQLNASAVSSFFMKPHIKEWIEQGRVVGLGSDIHGTAE